MLITGGSRGIGAATARLAASRGFDVAITYINNVGAAEKVVAEVEARGQKALAIRADMGSEGDIVRAFEETVSRLDGLDSLVYSAGMTAAPTRLADTDWVNLRRVMDVNLLGAMLACREACKRMSTKRGGKGGSIVLIGSRASYYQNPGRGLAYGTSKAGMDALNYGLGKEVAPEGIRVNLLSPGPIATEMNDPVKNAHRLTEIPMGRFGEPEEVAKAILFLATDESSFISSANIMISGAR
jgi:NAD(P)-dependent dehydrogenase (short-subunit alcohol dehydrogenase family)